MTVWTHLNEMIHGVDANRNTSWLSWKLPPNITNGKRTITYIKKNKHIQRRDYFHFATYRVPVWTTFYRTEAKKSNWKLTQNSTRPNYHNGTAEKKWTEYLKGTWKLHPSNTCPDSVMWTRQTNVGKMRNTSIN